jgi:type IV fimbrial biogenesis protein FimT
MAGNYGVEILMCPSSDGENCTDGFHWEQGWIAFQPQQGTNERRASDPVLLRQGALASKVRLITSAGRTHIHFQPSAGNVGSNATFTFCDGRGARAASAYALSNVGNLRSVPPEPDAVTEACAGI